MARSNATTVDAYLNELPEDRREVMTTLVDLIRSNLPKGYRESINFGQIVYAIPLETYPDTYNGQPLMYLALAAQKNYYALYLLGAYGDPKQREALQKAFAKSGKKMDMGKSCLRFRKLEDLPLKDIAKVIASTPPEKMIRIYEAARSQAGSRS
jgi:hypothetical protein